MVAPSQARDWIFDLLLTLFGIGALGVMIYSSFIENDPIGRLLAALFILTFVLLQRLGFAVRSLQEKSSPPKRATDSEDEADFSGE